MKTKLFFMAMMVAVLAFSLIFVGCDNGSTGGSNDGSTTTSGGETSGGDDRDALLGEWVKNGNANAKMKFQKLGSGSKTVYTISRIWTTGEYTASNGKVNVDQGEIIFDYVLSGNTLTVSNMVGTSSYLSGEYAATVKAMYEGTYTKQ